MRRALPALLAAGVLGAASMDPIPDLALDEDEADPARRVILVGGLDPGAVVTAAVEGAAPFLVISGMTRDDAAGTAAIAFTLRPEGNGQQVVLVAARDADGGSVARSCRVVVAPVNDAPAANPAFLALSLRVAGSAGWDPHASDPDIASGQQTTADLVYTLAAAPTACDLLLDGATLAVGGTFTQAAAGAGRVILRHRGANDGPASDACSLQLSDGIAAPVAVTCTMVITQTAPALDLGTAPATWVEHSDPLALCPAAVISDAEGGESAGVAVTATLLDGIAGDRLALAADPDGRPGVADGVLTWDGDPLGTVTGGAGAPLALAFTSRSAGYPEVQAVLRRLRYDHSGGDLADGTRTLQVVVAERADALLDAAATTAVTVLAVDDPPRITTTAVGTQRDVPATIALSAEDPDSATLRWQVLGASALAALAIDPASGSLRIVPAAGAVGSATVAVAVDDLANPPVPADLLLRITGPDEVRPQPLAEVPASVLAGEAWSASVPWDAAVVPALGDDAPAGLLLRMADATTLQASWTPDAGAADGAIAFTIIAVGAADGAAGRLPVLLRILPRPLGVR